MPPEYPPPATPAQAAEVFGAYGQVLPVPVGSTYADPWQGSDVPYAQRSPYPEPVCEGPACVTCLAPAGVEETALRPDPKGRRYPSGAQVLYCLPHLPAVPVAEAPVSVEEAAAAGVLDAVRAQKTEATSLDLAAAEARTEAQAELDELHTQLAVTAGAHRRVQAVLRLCEGRRGDDMLLVSAVAVAAESGTTALDGLPMTLTWTRRTEVHPTRGRASIECTSSYGGRADLVLTDEERGALAGGLTTEVRDTTAACPTPNCGTGDDLDATNPFLFGWSRLQIAYLGDGPRWYCSDVCVVDALARAGHELAAADRAAAVDPGEQGYGEASYLDASYGPGASDEYALQQAEAHAAGVEDERGDVDEADGHAEMGGDL